MFVCVVMAEIGFGWVWDGFVMGVFLTQQVYPAAILPH